MSPRAWWIVVLVGIAVFFVVRLMRQSRVPPEVVQAKIRDGAQILDVRTPNEFSQGAYPGAVNLPVQTLPDQLTRLRKDRPLVVYCASGVRSAVAVGLLKRAGFTDVVNAGSLRAMPR